MLKIAFTSVLLATLLCIVGCKVRPVYNEQELALANNAVMQFQECYNRQDYDGLYALMSEETRQTQSKEALLSAMRQSFEKWGKQSNADIVFAKVFPGPPVHVRMICNGTYEKGKAQQWFYWASDGKRPYLLRYEIFPGWTSPEAIKKASTK